MNRTDFERAVALHYDREGAPTVLASGEGEIARLIKEITALTTPKILPTRYIGTNIFVAGSRIVNVSTALAPISSAASTISA